MVLARWHRGVDGGRPLEGQAIMQLAFELGKFVEELDDADQYWISRMLLDREARRIAGAPTDKEFWLAISQAIKAHSTIQ